MLLLSLLTDNSMFFFFPWAEKYDTKATERQDIPGLTICIRRLGETELDQFFIALMLTDCVRVCSLTFEIKKKTFYFAVSK